MKLRFFHRPVISMSALVTGVCCALLSLTALSAHVEAQQDGPPKAAATDSGKSSLGVRQQRVARMMNDLEVRFRALARKLEQNEPERAARLIKAFEESRKLLIERRMTEIVAMLDAAKLDSANKEQQQVVSDLKSLIGLLIDEEFEKEDDEEEIAQLREWKENIKKLLAEERLQERESEKLEDPDETMRKLDEQMEKIEKLIDQEQRLIRKTRAARERGLEDLDELAGEQESIRKATEQLAAGMSDSDEPGDGGGEGQAGEGGQSGQPGQQPGAGGEPGQSELQDAAESQQAAERNLDNGKGRAAEQAEARAVKKLLN